MSTIKDEFLSKGYVLIKNFFSAEEVSKYLKLVESWPQVDEEWEFQYAIGDSVSKLEQFWPLIFHKKVVCIMKEILGPEVRYLQHSDIHKDITVEGRFDGDYRTLGYHRDTRFRNYNLLVKEYGDRSKAYISAHEGQFLGKAARRLLGEKNQYFSSFSVCSIFTEPICRMFC